MSLANSPDPALREAVVRQDLDNVLHPIVQHKLLETKQMVVAGGQGATIYDADGTSYLDAMAGLWCVNIGYGRTELADVAADQMRQLSYFPHTAMNVPAAGLAEKVNALMGGGYHTYFVNSGSEANEAGFKFARQYMKHEYPGQYRFKTISRYFSYHGTTLSTLDAGGMGERKAKFEPFSGDFVHVAQPYCYRCPFGLSYPSCELACVKNMENTILGEGPETVAEVIVEPVMSGVGVAVPPDEYLPEVEKLCREYGILLHIDEVINGFGRTGKMFAHQHYGVAPDLVAIAKGISSAYMPIAATVVKNSVFDSFYGDAADNRQVMQVNTYGGHPAAAAVALRNIEIMEAEKLVERSADVGAYLLDGLRTLMRHKIVGDVRGKGLLLGVELVKDRTTKQPVDASVITQIVDFCRDNGVIVGRAGGGRRYGNTITLSPPLVITRAECDRLVDTLDRALATLR
ncbi:MAG: aminotransferase class III-fold pyridoxal phosphate-dependent enzyme [Proteobacteria bacterium]|nr:aminotransferase class III-fold pyridoxal phosphate-dependent enzyme [Pseudomonadota bacterium]